MDAGSSLEVCFQIWARPRSGKGKSLRTADGETSIEVRGSGWSSGARTNLTRREAPLAAAIEVSCLSRAHMGHWLGKGGGGKEGRSGAEWVEWRGKTEGNDTTFSSH